MRWNFQHAVIQNKGPYCCHTEDEMLACNMLLSNRIWDFSSQHVAVVEKMWFQLSTCCCHTEDEISALNMLLSSRWWDFSFQHVAVIQKMRDILLSNKICEICCCYTEYEIEAFNMLLSCRKWGYIFQHFLSISSWDFSF